MKSKLLNIFIITFIVISTLVLTGCTSKEDKAEDIIRGFIEKHYVVDEEDIDMYHEYVTKGSVPGDKLSEDTKEFAEYMTEEGYNDYEASLIFSYRLRQPYLKKCTVEVDGLNIKEKDKSDDMRRFNITFHWTIKNDKGETVKKHEIDKDIYLSEEHGDWLINQYNSFEIIDEKDF
ncbi:hypothetical protein [Clostridium sp.]|uniref:hypothetical protein n=1 Tax=Clostridium sp. TaxID=1506 RepID=UPI003463B3B6